eukprot:jgi/Botrbrau1/5424/Bobra.182_1s0026.1
MGLVLTVDLVPAKVNLIVHVCSLCETRAGKHLLNICECMFVRSFSMNVLHIAVTFVAHDGMPDIGTLTNF